MQHRTIALGVTWRQTMKLCTLGTISYLIAFSLANVAEGQDFNPPRHIVGLFDQVLWLGSGCWNINERCVAGDWGEGNEFIVTNHCPARVYVRLCYLLTDGRDTCQEFGVNGQDSVRRSGDYDIESAQWYYVGSVKGGLPGKPEDFPKYSIATITNVGYLRILLAEGGTVEYVTAHIAHITGQSRDFFCANLAYDDWGKPMNWE